MIFWGILWFGILGLMFAFEATSFGSWFYYLLIGALAGLHLNSIWDKKTAQMKAELVRQHAQALAELNIHPAATSAPAAPYRPHTENATLPTFDAPSESIPQIQLPSSEPQPASLDTTPTAVKPLPQSIRRGAPVYSTTQPQQPPKPIPPSFIEVAFIKAKNWLFGGNTVLRVGLVVLFIGLAFLAKYTAQLGLFPIQARLSIVALFGVALLAFGFFQRLKVPQYALSLQGAGVAILYLTILAAMKGYDLLPMTPALVLMVAICALGCALAYLQNSLLLAIISFAGGFAAPILLSTGESNYIGLFSYYTVLNLAILMMASVKTWRPLNLLGFFATFGVATMWGVLSFRPDNYLPTQLFLIIFFVIYLLTALLYARNTAKVDTLRHTPVIDNVLIFATPLIAFGLQIGLVRGFEYGAAFSALAMAAIYIVCAFVLVRQTRGYNALLLECFLALGVGFLTLAIPLALNGQWIAVAWALEGLGAFWVGKRQARWMPRAMGVVLQVVSGVLLLTTFAHAPATPFFNTHFLNFLILVVCALLIAYWLRTPLTHSNSAWARQYATVEQRLNRPFYLYGFALAVFAIAHQWRVPLADTLMPWVSNTQHQSFLIASSILALITLSAYLGHKISAVAHWPVYAFAPVLVDVLLVLLTLNQPLLSGFGWVFWAAALLLLFGILYHAEPKNWLTAPALHLNHALIVWFKFIVMAQTVYWYLSRGELAHTAWVNVIYLVLATVFLIALTIWAGRARSTHYPLRTQQNTYLLTAALPIAILVLVGSLLIALMSSGDTRPLPYIPLLNPTDLSIGLGLASLVLWRQKIKQLNLTTPLAHSVTQLRALPILAIAGFVLMNTVWLRIAHHYFGVAWNAQALFDSYVVQMGYAILWTLLALVTMIWAHKKSERMVWMVGAGLLGLTVLKLILIDLANQGGFERIVAFITVGVMMLVIGYFAPLPPRTAPIHPRDEA